jgi:hypothetical protein
MPCLKIFPYEVCTKIADIRPEIIYNQEASVPEPETSVIIILATLEVPPNEHGTRGCNESVYFCHDPRHSPFSPENEP